MAIVYATPQDVADYMGIALGDLPSNILILIERAQDLVDYVTLNRILDYYLNDDETAIIDAEVEEGANKATSAQVEYWINTDTSLDITNTGNIGNYSIGNWSITYNGKSGESVSVAILAPRAKRHLFKAGLLYRGIPRCR